MVASWTHATADKSEMIVLYKMKAKTFNQIWLVRFHLKIFLHYPGQR